MLIRAEKDSDRDATHALLTDAFGQAQEADLVDNLHADGDPAISLVARDRDEVIGHVALSRLRPPAGALALAPLAVTQSGRCSGVGASLVKAAIATASQIDDSIVFVLGDPAHYTRFGFDVELAAAFPSPYAGPHFMPCCSLPIRRPSRRSRTVTHSTSCADQQATSALAIQPLSSRAKGNTHQAQSAHDEETICAPRF